MKRAHAFGVAAGLLLGFVVACSEVTAPRAPEYLLLSGVWEVNSGTPGGSLIKIATFAAGGEINGIGVAFNATTTDSFKVRGQYSADGGSFGLSIAYSGGKSATFAGTVQGTASLSGTWTDGSTGASSDLTFIRLPVPPCSDSVPLLGTYDPAAPGFIVRFQDTVNATAEAARLAATYDFATTHVYEVTIRGFAAVIPLTTVTVLRCEPKVTSIEYHASVTIAGPAPRP